VLASNWAPDENESIQVVVDEIWNTYDLDQTGILERDEIKKFMKDYMPDFKKNYKFDEEGFNALYDEFDLDGNGIIEKNELAQFIKNMILHND
jgi:Ca2+-binding EF-hand superfamily protein